MKECWEVRWLEKWPDGTVNAYRTAECSESIFGALAAVERELAIRGKANGTECEIYQMEKIETDKTLIGKAEVIKVRNGLPVFRKNE